MVPMTLGPRGSRLIKDREVGPGNGPALVAFLPTPTDRPTIGWGRAHDVKLGDVCTPAQADAWFREDTAHAARLVNQRLTETGVPLSQSMFDALVVLVYNLEIPILPGHTIGDAWAARDYFGMFRGFSLYTKQVHSDLRGLAIRRANEMALFFEDKLP